MGVAPGAQQQPVGVLCGHDIGAQLSGRFPTQGRGQHDDRIGFGAVDPSSLRRRHLGETCRSFAAVLELTAVKAGLDRAQPSGASEGRVGAPTRRAIGAVVA